MSECAALSEAVIHQHGSEKLEKRTKWEVIN